MSLLVKVLSSSNFGGSELSGKGLFILSIGDSYGDVLHQNWCSAKAVLCCSFSAPVRYKLWKSQLENSETLEISETFFPSFLNLSFRFRLYGKMENSGMRKLGTIFPRFLIFRYATCSFFKKKFLNILK